MAKSLHILIFSIGFTIGIILFTELYYGIQSLFDSPIQSAYTSEINTDFLEIQRNK